MLTERIRNFLLLGSYTPCLKHVVLGIVVAQRILEASAFGDLGLFRAGTERQRRTSVRETNIWLDLVLVER